MISEKISRSRERVLFPSSQCKARISGGVSPTSKKDLTFIPFVVKGNRNLDHPIFGGKYARGFPELGGL
jgi:hypothetical protein